MKIMIDATPTEFAELLSAFVNNSHKSFQEAEERIGNLILSGLAKVSKKEVNTIDEEVPSGGYFH
jgi:hypothetical protein